MGKPLIGVVPLVDIQRESLWMIPGYMRGIEQAGGIPVMLPLPGEDEKAGGDLLNAHGGADCKEVQRLQADELAERLDGVLLTGGQDVDPALYGEKPLAQCGETVRLRDKLERELLEQMVSADKPVLGICRGIQLINVCYGGTLYQDIPSQYETETEHHMTPPYDRYVHDVNIRRDSLLYRIIGQERIPVNSYHHQAVRRLGDGLEAMAYSEDGLIEAVGRQDCKYLVAVQWHPELLFHRDEPSRRLFQSFVDACGK